jgi:hypothetical protein
MLRVTFLSTKGSIAKEFERCCQEYESLDFASAWCGDPQRIPLYLHLRSLSGRLRATVGKSFNQTHPDALDFLSKLGADLRVFRDDGELFHPKLYLFAYRDKRAIFIGSSNFTFRGFYRNEEANVLLEGVPSEAEAADLERLERQLELWHSDQFSLTPSPDWISAYRVEYEQSLKKEEDLQLKTPLQDEESIASASWLSNATWATYWREVEDGLQRHNRSAAGYHECLDAAAQKLTLPWTVQYFDDLERRKIMGGIEPYGWLGHVAASGRFRQLLAKGNQDQRRTIVEAINAVAVLNPPMDWNQLKQSLEKLCELGPSMKVWSRLLTVVRPDLYCTISSNSVRKNLSEILRVPRTHFEDVNGYVELLRLLHSSPWFQSAIPREKIQAEVWTRRTAFLDAIFHD